MKIINKPKWITEKEIENILDSVLKERRIRKFKKRNKNVIIKFDSILQNQLDWYRKPCVIEINIHSKGKFIKTIIAHEFVHYLDFINNGYWNADLPHAKAKNNKDFYFCCPHEFLAEDIAQELFGYKNWKELPFKVFGHS